MSKHILSVSYDMSLLATRKMLLEQKGYAVVNALGFSKAHASYRTGGFVSSSWDTPFRMMTNWS
jgi:hypothetical protein